VDENSLFTCGKKIVQDYYRQLIILLASEYLLLDYYGLKLYMIG